MSDRVVVLGAGYAGAGAIRRLERRLPRDADLTWVSREDHHFVRHEIHRLIRDPAAADVLAIPVDEIASPGTRFVRGEVVGVETGDRVVRLADGTTVGYDALVVALGSETAFYGVPGVGDHALTLGTPEDALGIHDAVVDALGSSTRGDPARVLVAGAGLSGIQSAGEVAALARELDRPVEVRLVEALDELLPGEDGSLRRAVHRRLHEAGIAVTVGSPVVGVNGAAVELDGGERMAHDVLLWTGGITGPEALADVGIATDGGRVPADTTFQTAADRVFAIGDAAAIEGGGTEIPPTARAAWSAATVAADNVVRALEGRPLSRFAYRDRGTLLSVGDAAIAHDLPGVPVRTFGGPAARVLKKAAAARWIAHLTSVRPAAAAWPAL